MPLDPEPARTDAEWFLGVDVQERRGCAYVLLDREAACHRSGWILGATPDERAERLRALVEEVEAEAGRVPVGPALGVLAWPAPA